MFFVVIIMLVSMGFRLHSTAFARDRCEAP
jgi:hypothetical protein